jgi:hypothetical protein
MCYSLSYSIFNFFFFFAQYTQEMLKDYVQAASYVAAFFCIQNSQMQKDDGMWHHMLGPKVSSWVSDLLCNLFWVWKVWQRVIRKVLIYKSQVKCLYAWL